MSGFDRYHRQMLLPGIGREGQERLSGSHAMIVGCGALGCVSADLLVRAGVGTVTIVDRDLVELTNLQRQVLFDERDAAEHAPKAEAAKRRLGAINSSVEVRAVVADFSARTAERLMLQRPNVLIDGTDNYETRYLLNDVAVRDGVPLVYAGVVGTRAMAMTIVPGVSACLRCVFADVPAAGSQPTCETAGVFGPVVSIIAGYQASEALKILVGASERVMRSLLAFDLWAGTRHRLDLSEARDPACVCCGLRRFEFLDARNDGATVSLCGQGAVQISPTREAAIDLRGLGARLGGVGSFRVTEYCVIGALAEERGDDGEGIALTVFADGRAVVRGVRSAERARAIYARYVGI